jgi:hypothetical protein
VKFRIFQECNEFILQLVTGDNTIDESECYIMKNPEMLHIGSFIWKISIKKVWNTTYVHAKNLKTFTSISLVLTHNKHFKLESVMQYLFLFGYFVQNS